MSVQAMTWAFRQKMKSSIKFVLITLCDYADAENRLWPSISDLVEKTCMDRKTIMAAIDTLEKNGYLIDTGERRGRTKQVKVYFVDTNSTGNGTVKECQKRNSTENGTVPDFPSKSTVFPAKEYQISPERVPKTVHGTINEPLKEPSGNRQKAQAPFSTDLLVRGGVPDDVARDFAELRKRLKAPISETAVKGLIREAQKAGMTLTEVLETVCANGWRGFKADWITKGSGKKTETIAERNARIEREIFGQSLDDEARTIDMEKIA